MTKMDLSPLSSLGTDKKVFSGQHKGRNHLDQKKREKSRTFIDLLPIQTFKFENKFQINSLLKVGSAL